MIVDAKATAIGYAWSYSAMGHEVVSHTDGLAALCRMLVSAGVPEDASMRVFDTRGMHCMTVKRVHRYALRTLTEGVKTNVHTKKYQGFDSEVFS